MISDQTALSSILDSRFTESDPGSEVPRAAVAAVFRGQPRGPAELLFIQRAKKQSDPWSGQMAFPGGRAEPTDQNAKATAMRETLEEIGLDLSAAHFAGSLSELDGGRATRRFINVSAHGFWLDGPRPELSMNYEVADVVWVPLADLGDPNRYIRYHYPPTGADFPGIQLDQDDQVIWGLTLRFLSDLFRRMGQPFVIDE